MINRILFSLLALLPIQACSMSQEGRQLSNEAAVTFLGSTSSMSFQVDESEIVPVGAPETRYLIDAGPHVIRVYRDGKLIVNQNIYAAPGQTVEVRVR
jgi:hypothetical protein